MNVPVQHIAITCDDGSLDIMSFILEGRSQTLPFGAVDKGDSYWTREANLENIDSEIAKTYAGSEKKPTGFRLVAENEIPTDRSNRKDWKDDGKKIVDGKKIK